MKKLIYEFKKINKFISEKKIWKLKEKKNICKILKFFATNLLYFSLFCPQISKKYLSQLILNYSLFDMYNGKKCYFNNDFKKIKIFYSKITDEHKRSI